MAQSLSTLTQIAAKRLSGKALTSAILGLGSEKFGSTVQTTNTTVFAESIPNDPHLGYLTIQSSSLNGAGTVMLIDFDLSPDADSAYDNDVYDDANDDAGENPFSDITEGDSSITYPNTFHAYHLRLTGSFQAEINAASGSDYFNNNASTPTTLGTYPFINNGALSGSLKLQILPEYVSTVAGSSNKYIPKLSATNGANIDPTSGIDWYLDPFAGVLFVQDPVDYNGSTSDITATPNIGATVPGRIRAFVYVGKYQDELPAISNFHVSSSNGGFTIDNLSSASFDGGDSGLTVFTSSVNSNELLFGSKSDAVEFANITASIGSSSLSNVVYTNLGVGGEQTVQGSLRLTGNITAEEYVVSSSVTFMTQSFSSGSTIFGDTNDDLHEFTGSLLLIRTSSNFGLEITGSGISIENVPSNKALSITGSIFATGGLSIDEGDNGSVTLGKHNVGIDLASPLPITGSGLIVSQSGLSANHFNMMKVGEVEFVDYYGGVTPSLLIDVKHDRAIILSSSNTANPIAAFSNGADTLLDHRLYSASKFVLQINKSTNTFGGQDGAVPGFADGANTKILGKNLTFNVDQAQGGTLQFNVSESFSNMTTTASFIVGTVANPDVVPSGLNASHNVRSIDLRDNFFTLTPGGNVTASYISGSTIEGQELISDGDISASGVLFASASQPAAHAGSILAIVYDTGSGEFHYTGSYGAAGGDIVDIAFSGSDGGTFSINNTDTASFSSPQTGLTIVSSSTGPGILIGTSSDNILFANITASVGFNGIITSASVAEQVRVLNDESTNADFSIPFTDLIQDPSALPNATASLKVDQTTFTYNPSAGSLRVGDTTDRITIKGSDGIVSNKSEIHVFDTGSATINFGRDANTIRVGNSGSAIIEFAGSASIDGDLIVKGNTTTLNVDNLLVEDRYILLGSSSANNSVGGGIIVQQNLTTVGAALHWDEGNKVWAVEVTGSNASSNDIGNATFPIVTVSSSAGTPGNTDTPAMGASDAYRFGQIYVDTSDAHGLYVYLP